LSKSGPIFSIQILRGIAALFVVIGHSQGLARELASFSLQSFKTWQLIPWGVGVDLFFVISGFIIAYTSEKYITMPEPRRSFAAHRIARLVPLYWFCTALFLGLLASKRGLGFAQAEVFPSVQAIVTSLLFLPTDGVLGNGLAFPVYNLGWTLNYEMFFYALFALCLARSTVLSALRVLVLLGVIVLAGAIFNPGVLPLSFWYQPIILEFGTGILIAIAMRRGVTLVLPIRIGLVAIGSFLIVALPFGQSPEINGTLFNGFTRFYVLGVPSALLIAAAALGPDVKPRPWLTIPIEIGNASYSLYLVHPFAIFLTSMAFRRFGLVSSIPLPLLVVIVITLATIGAVISYRAFERPSYRLVSDWLLSKRRAAMEPN
jgi:exopolysaccharide production protein ExoZ